MINACSHLRPFLNGKTLFAKATQIVAHLSLTKVDFEAVAFIGVSGALFAPIVAAMLGKSVIIVRKPNENAHSWFRVEGDTEIKKYIIVDDLISSGTTVNNIREAIAERLSSTAQCVGIVVYNHDGQGDDDYDKEYDSIPVYNLSK